MYFRNVGRGVHGTQTQKSTFPNEFCVDIPVTVKVHQKKPNKAKISKIGLPVSKWRPNKQILCRDTKIPTKISKTAFPKKICDKNWLKVEDCKYNYIFEIKFEKKYSV